jgi:hypothetical protein
LLIAKKRDLKQAAMQQLLTGQTRLPGFIGEWEVKTVSQIALKIIDYRGPTPLKLVMEWEVESSQPCQRTILFVGQSRIRA